MPGSAEPQGAILVRQLTRLGSPTTLTMLPHSRLDLFPSAIFFLTSNTGTDGD
jgi:hypothetical protein